jgi:hypothetical protein
MIFNFIYNSVNKNNYSVNLRITETPKAIRNNQYNEYSGKFVINPTTSINPINNQKISTVYCVNKKTFNSF